MTKITDKIDFFDYFIVLNKLIIRNYNLEHREKKVYASGIAWNIGSIMRGFKIGVTKWFRKMTPGLVIWQRNYYEHIIRDEKSLFLIRKYTHENQKKLDVDSENHITRQIHELTKKNTSSIYFS